MNFLQDTKKLERESPHHPVKESHPSLQNLWNDSINIRICCSKLADLQSHDFLAVRGWAIKKAIEFSLHVQGPIQVGYIQDQHPQCPSKISM